MIGKSRCRNDLGFTIVELLVTLVIIGILASAVIPMAEVAVQRGKEQTLRENLRTIRKALDAYKAAVDEGRIAKKADESGYPKALEDLVIGVPDIKNPKGASLRFLRQIPQDPFSEVVETGKGNSWGKRSYVSSREEPKEGADVFDVYSVAPGSGLNGKPYREW